MIGPITGKGTDMDVMIQLLLRAGVSADHAEYQAQGMLEDAREQTEIKRE